MEDGYIRVEMFDKSLGRTIEKIIDIDGEEKFFSEYSSIYSFMPGDFWEVTVNFDGERKHGLIDRNGNQILPCIYDFQWNSISEKNRRIINNDSEGVEVIDFEGNVIICPGRYDEIKNVHQSVFNVYKKAENGQKYAGLVTLEGKEIIPPVYESITLCNDNYVICRDNQGCTMMRIIKK